MKKPQSFTVGKLRLIQRVQKVRENTKSCFIARRFINTLLDLLFRHVTGAVGPEEILEFRVREELLQRADFPSDNRADEQQEGQEEDPG